MRPDEVLVVDMLRFARQAARAAADVTLAQRGKPFGPARGEIRHMVRAAAELVEQRVVHLRHRDVLPVAVRVVAVSP